MTVFIRTVFAKPGHILTVTLASVVFSLLVWLSVLSIPGGENPQSPSSLRLELVLHTIGLDPKTLTASGVDAAQVQVLVREARTALENVNDALVVAESELSALRVREADLERMVRAGIDRENALQALTQARVALADAEQRVASARQAIWNAATAHLQSGVVSKVQRVAQARRWELPIEYAAAERSEQEWVELREALSHVRWCQSRGESVDESASSVVSRENSRTEVAEAKVRLDTYFDVVSASFRSAVDE